MLEYVKLFLLSGLSGLLIRIILGLAGQKWATTFHNTVSYLLLPVIGVAITKSISGNIALSLGMVGALSIVRFRHPVKSPLELVIFFLLLTLGITYTVDTRLGILLVLYFCVVIPTVEVFRKIRGDKNFSISFQEGVSQHSLEIKSKTPIKELAENRHLILFNWEANSNEYFYRISSESKSEIVALNSSLTENKQIVSLQIRFT